MKYIKLFIISIIVFGGMLFLISLLFPSNTIVSRAVNVGGSKDSLVDKLPIFYNIAFQQEGEKVPEPSLSYKSDIFIKYSDTLLQKAPFNPNIQQGAAVYETVADSTVIQVFYKIHVPTYKFWDKFGLMLNEAKYGPSLDSAVSRIKKQYQ